MLGYADDYVILADSHLQLSKQLKTLNSYCKNNKIIVNTEKTKIVIFTRSGNTSAKKFKAFKYGSENIEVVKKYNYFGVIFNNWSSFLPASSRPVSASNSAVGKNIKTIHTPGMDTWD